MSKEEIATKEKEKPAKQEASKEEIIPAPNVDYTYVGNNQKRKKSSQKYKKIFTPNGRMITGFMIIILGVIIITVINFPFSSFMSANLSTTTSIGFPFVFASFQLSGENVSFNILELLKDLLLYIVLAYLINILINLLTNLSSFKEKVVVEEQPTVFKDQKITAPEKVAEKVVGEK